MSSRLFLPLLAALLTVGFSSLVAQTAADAAGRVPAKLKPADPVPYPEALRPRKLTGTVSFSGVVDVMGKLSDPHVLAATHVDFVAAAYAAISARQFEPATENGKPVASKFVGALTFADLGADRLAVLKANDITGSDGQPPKNAPLLYAVADPVFPGRQLLAGDSGEAIAVFVVRPNGLVGEVQVRSASKPEYGEALRAAIECWLFRPAMKDGEAVAVTLAKRAYFRAVPKNAPGTKDELSRIVVAARQDKIGTAKGLDHPLTPIYQVTPSYPAEIASTTKEAGEALISMVICQDGRVRLVQAVSASQPAFGWAAVTAVSQWIFEAPTRGGQPVDVRVQLPVKFGAMKK